MKWEKVDTEYYLKRILEQIKIHNEKQDEFLNIMREISMMFKIEKYSYEDIKKEEFKNILKKGSFTTEQMGVLKELASLFNDVLTNDSN